MGGLSCSDATSITAQTKDTSGVFASLTFKVIGYGVGAINFLGILLVSNTDYNPRQGGTGGAQ